MTENEVAKYMVKRLEEEKILYQAVIVSEIEQKFGEPFFYYNENGHSAISRKVIKEFTKMTPNVVWVSGEKFWRLRQKYDDPGRTQTNSDNSW
jgi:hypothetical protein